MKTIQLKHWQITEQILMKKLHGWQVSYENTFRVIREVQVKTTNYYYTLLKWSKSQNPGIIKCW
jgi:hypothetical protein